MAKLEKQKHGGALLRPAKGETLNPNGRPRKLPELDVLLAEVLGGGDNDTDGAMAILSALWKKAREGDVRAAEVLLNRGYGLPKQHIEHTGKDDGPIENKILVITKPSNGNSGD